MDAMDFYYYSMDESSPMEVDSTHVVPQFVSVHNNRTNGGVFGLPGVGVLPARMANVYPPPTVGAHSGIYSVRGPTTTAFAGGGRHSGCTAW
jgi:hypothetical protein